MTVDLTRMKKCASRLASLELVECRKDLGGQFGISFIERASTIMVATPPVTSNFLPIPLIFCKAKQYTSLQFCIMESACS